MVTPTVPTEEAWLREQIATFEQRLDQLRAGAVTVSAPPAPPVLPQRPGPQRPMSQPATTPPPTMPPPTMPPPTGPPSDVPPPPTFATGQRAPATPRKPMTLPAAESLLKWSGLILMFLSAVFLVSTAIQRGWIGPELQLVGAGTIGVALIAGGLVIGERRDGWDVPLASVGIAVLSATTTAGWQWLELWSREPWIVGSFLVLGAAISLTVRLGGPGVAGTGLAVTLVSLAFLADSAPEAAMLCAIAVVLLEVVSLWRRLTSLHVMTAIGGLTSLGLAAIAFAIDGDGSLNAILGAGTVVTLVLWLMPLAMSERKMLPSPIGANWRPTADRLAISLPALFAGAWSMAGNLTDEAAGVAFLVVGVLAMISGGVAVASGRFDAPLWVSQLMGGMLAIAIGSTLLLDRPSLLLGLAVQAAALLVFVNIVPDRFASVQAWAMASIAGFIAFVGMVEAIDQNAAVVDDLVHLAVVAMVAAWAWWELSSTRRARADVGAVLAALAFGGFVLWPVSALIHVDQGQALISAAWAALGFATLVGGFARSSIRLTQVSLATLGVVMVKLLTIDLAAVDTFWRVALFFVLGGTFLFASFRLGSAIRRQAGTDASVDTPDDDSGRGGPDQGGPDQGGPDQGSGLAFQK